MRRATNQYLFSWGHLKALCWSVGLCLSLGLGFSPFTLADSQLTNAQLNGPQLTAPQKRVAQLQEQWAITNYQTSGDAQKTAYEKLLQDADQALAQYPNNADILIWSGIIKSSYAGAKGGIGALKYAKASKADLEQALRLNEKALDGSAYTSLGTLYFKVPGWPIGFGDDKKAEELLLKALQINPTGIDPNYFYAEYLRDNGDYTQAKAYYQTALKAPDRPNRPLADAGRRQEIQQALDALQSKLH